VQSEHFEAEWLAAETESHMNDVLMRDDYFLQGTLEDYPVLLEQAGQKIADIQLPASCLITLLKRRGKIIVATPEMELKPDDNVVIIGEPEDLNDLRENNFTPIQASLDLDSEE